jgi:hypothetical protein
MGGIHNRKFSNIFWTSTQDLDKKNILKFKDQFVIGSISKQITAVLVLVNLKR